MVLAAGRWGRKCCLLVRERIAALYPSSSSSSLNRSASKCRLLYSSIANSSLLSRHYSNSSGLHPQLSAELLDIIEMRASEIERRSVHLQRTMTQTARSLNRRIFKGEQGIPKARELYESYKAVEGKTKGGSVRLVGERLLFNICIDDSLNDFVKQVAEPAIGTPPAALFSPIGSGQQLSTALMKLKNEKIKQEVVGLKSLIAECTEDKDMHEMARQELDGANEAVKELQCLLLKSLLPKDDADERDCILEVRAGTGGEEASLFAMDLFKMYERYSLKKGWKFEVVDIMESDLKGCKEASGAISGHGAYGILKFESGIHRVQRVPVTEKSGRVHTSAVSVAILPQADEVDVQLRSEDLRIDTYRSGGSGGQHANTTNSAVRITHIPTGIVVSIQDERSQHMNKAKALKVLCSKLYETERRRIQASRSKLRSELIGSGDRSERIRTYNFPQGRVTDHRVGLTCHNIHDVLQGESLDILIDGLLLQEEINAVASFASD